MKKASITRVPPVRLARSGRDGTAGPANACTGGHRRIFPRLEEKNRNLRRVTTEVLTLATELRKGTIDRIMAMSDLELCLQALLGTLPPDPRHCVQYATVHFYADGPSAPTNKPSKGVRERPSKKELTLTSS